MSIAEPIFGVDVASHQGNVNWPLVKQQGFQFAIVKATEGNYYSNPFYPEIRKARAQGLINGAYHYLTHDPVREQLNRFFSVAGDNFDNRLVALDVEAASTNPTATDTWNFIHGLRDRIGKHDILLYSARWYWGDILGNPNLKSLVDDYGVKLWSARYVNGEDIAAWTLYQRVPESWWVEREWGGYAPKILQFSGSAWIAGQRMDANAFAGKRSTLVAMTKNKE